MFNTFVDLFLFLSSGSWSVAFTVLVGLSFRRRWNAGAADAPVVVEYRSKLDFFSHFIFLFFPLCYLQQTALPAISVLDLVCSHFFPLVLFSCLDFLFFSQWWWFCVSSRPVPRGVLVQDSSCLSRSMPAVCLDLVPLCFSPLILSVTVCLWFLTFSQS